MVDEKELQRLQLDGFCVVEGVIPSDRVGAICGEVVAAQAAQQARTDAELAKTRARGHRIGNPGVGSLRQVINYTQGFAPFLADAGVLGLAEAVFGPYVRISCTDCVVTQPGTTRGYWHADWPYNRTNASHLPPPYPDTMLHMATIWMLTDFTADNGATLLVPGSHRMADNPAAGHMAQVDQEAPYPTEIQAIGAAGSVLVYDSRLWHAVAPNCSDQQRVGLIVRYAPWWLNLNPTQIGRPEHTAMVVETGGKNYESPPLKAEVFADLPKAVQPLYRHWVEGV